MNRPASATANRVLIALVALGAGLRLYQWAVHASLWLDEISLSRNILALPLGDLVTKRLAFDQVAPPGFLAAAKVSTLLFGESEQALWLFPLLAGLAGLVLFAWLARRMLRGHAIPIAVALYAIGLGLIRYSAEVKQYGVDAGATIALTLIALDLRERDRSTRALVAVGAVGFLFALFSQTSALVMAGLGFALLIAWMFDRDRRSFRTIFITMPIWAAASLFAVAIGERSMSASTHAFMQDFWRGGFLPLPPKVSTAVPWLWQRVEGLFGDPWTLHYPWAWLFALLAIGGIAVLWRTRRDAALMIAGPFLITLAASIVHLYPLRSRLTMFLVPSALLAASAAAGWLADRVARRTSIGGLAIAAATLVLPLIAIMSAGLPVRVDNYYPLYSHLQANRRPGDAVYVSFLAYSSAVYYGPRYGLQPGEFYRGTCSRDDTRAYIRDLDRFRGQPRVWLILRGGPAYVSANDAMRRYFRTIGVLRDALVVRSAIADFVAIELFDLSDPVRLRAADAETFPVKPMPAYPQPGCRDWSGDPRAILAAGSM